MEDTRKFFKRLTLKNKTLAKKISQLSKNSAKRNHQIWGVCKYLKSENMEDCFNCPEWEGSCMRGYESEPVQRMCYSLAEECLTIARGELPVDEKGNVIKKYISRTCKAANVNKPIRKHS